MMSSISKKTYEIDDIKHVKKYTLVISKCMEKKQKILFLVLNRFALKAKLSYLISCILYICTTQLAVVHQNGTKSLISTW